ncbi:MAG: DNA gyrase subunit A [Ruminococcaceae bacterium]|nr:DNA gyrase subunit A [Oscillospiraceae bacterium]
MEKENYEYKDQKIVDVNMEKEVKRAFLEYSMSVIMSRALPDVRDGLKPVHRRILYSMYEDHLTSDKAFRKSATTVGNVLGRYHPHGDASVYDAMVRLAQPFSLRYTLVEGHGNFGSIDGDPAAAYRYTEARLSKLSNEMMADIEKDVVDFMPNFDNRLKEPTVLPSRFPNLLVNGSVGIAVGMATNIPPHNLGEVIDGAIYLMENPDADIPALMEFIKGPDFPTKASIFGSNGIYQAYTTGKGHITVRAKAHIEEENYRIIVTELPYAVNKSILVQNIAQCAKDKKIEGIRDVQDESDDMKGIRIVIPYRHDVNGEVILNQLYKYTQLQDTFAVNMLALVDNVPRILNLKQMLEHYIKHQEDVTTRKIRFELNKAMHEAHILEGYKIAIDNIDEVIEIIKRSESIPDAREKLEGRFGLSEAQAQAIVDMTLGKLSGLERTKVEERLMKLHELIKELSEIVSDESRIKGIIKEDLLEIKRKYGDDRRTDLVPYENEIMIEDLIERHSCVITMTHGGYIKRLPADTYTSQHRGGKGIIGMSTKEDDFVERVVSVNSHSFVMMFTDKGKVYTKKAYQIPESGRTAKGTSVINVIDIEPGEKVTAMISVTDFPEEEYLTMVTRNGIVKRTRLSEFAVKRKGGKIALSLDEGDELVFVRHTKGSDHIIVATKKGNAARFDENDIRVMGRSARGVIGIRVKDGDAVVGATLVDGEKQIITVTEKGYGKRSSFDDFQCHNRGGKGVCCHNLSSKTGDLAGIATVDEYDDVMMITNEGTVIRTPVSGIPVYGRTAGGVIVMRTADNSYIVNFARVAREEDAEELPETEGEPDGEAIADEAAELIAEAVEEAETEE